MKIKWNQLGGQLGIGLAVLGGLFLFLGWNGAASYDNVTLSQTLRVSEGGRQVRVRFSSQADLYAATNALRVLPGETSTRQIDSLGAGDHRVTLEGAPFEATVRAEE